MNLDDLSKNIRKTSEEKIVQKLADHIQDWKINEKNAIELSDGVERFLGNTWIENRTDFDKIYGMWSEFRISAIEGIGGMTMNERLYRFGLFELFDKEKDIAKQNIFYHKLLGKK